MYVLKIEAHTKHTNSLVWYSKCQTVHTLWETLKFHSESSAIACWCVRRNSIMCPVRQISSWCSPYGWTSLSMCYIVINSITKYQLINTYLSCFLLWCEKKVRKKNIQIIKIIDTFFFSRRTNWIIEWSAFYNCPYLYCNVVPH